MKKFYLLLILFVLAFYNDVWANGFKYFRKIDSKSAEIIPKESTICFLIASELFGRKLVIFKDRKLYEIKTPNEGISLNIISPGSTPQFSISNANNEKIISEENINSWVEAESVFPSKIFVNINSKSYNGIFKIDKYLVYRGFIMTFKKVDTFGDSIVVVDKLNELSGLFKEKPEDLNETKSERIKKEIEMEREEMLK